jgi:pilus assembly protein CpaF
MAAAQPVPIAMAAFGKRTGIIPALAPIALKPAVPATPGPTAAGPPTAAGQTATTVAQRDTSPDKDYIREQVLQRIEPAIAVKMTQVDLTVRVNQLVAEIATERNLLLNRQEQHDLGHEIVDDMIGLGPLEPLLRDETISDILINGARMIFVERKGKLQFTSLQFRSDAQVMHVAQRIASSVGRRIDESSPMLDARL